MNPKPTRPKPSTSASSDRIEKEIVLRAPRSRVWRAITDAREFGAWFRARMVGEFRAGKTVTGRITNPGHEHLELELEVVRMEPERLFSFRWHPYAVDPKVDYASEPTTLVEFHLADSPGGTRLTVIESGFDALPAERREVAFRMNSGGWEAQLQNVKAHVDA
jgi:uncharacterized protein YndB with AHSA1/START domain